MAHRFTVNHSLPKNRRGKSGRKDQNLRSPLPPQASYLVECRNAFPHAPPPKEEGGGRKATRTWTKKLSKAQSIVDWFIAPTHAKHTPASGCGRVPSSGGFRTSTSIVPFGKYVSSPYRCSPNSPGKPRKMRNALAPSRDVSLGGKPETPPPAPPSPPCKQQQQ